MRFRAFGKTNLQVSEIGMGCQSIGGDLYSRHDGEAMRTLERAFDLGINFFDTANTYSSGRSEELIGKVFKGKRDRVILASKAGVHYAAGWQAALRARALVQPIGAFLKPLKCRFLNAKRSRRQLDFGPENLRESLEGTLKRLQTDYLDLLLLHHPTPAVLRSGEVFETLEALRQEGKIRHYGASCDTIEEGLICIESTPVAALQIELSLVNQAAIDPLLSLAPESGVAIIARQPFGRGVVAGPGVSRLADHLAKDQDVLARAKSLAGDLQFLRSQGRSMYQAALQFVLAQPGVSTAIMGVSKVAHLEENLKVYQAPDLTAADIATIRKLCGFGPDNTKSTVP